ncbi:MAG: uncharacterized protein KVP18_000510 [Porospora cf. gigantea A]|uniref:uncharacterized protein n=1 Tax=Porospora cf. gigantea A TaxID=2853593 RepID=UPI00355A4E68|nr:MAG: hypothetical protein KVP18_000510 [Porospora cf. gigantea A]
MRSRDPPVMWGHRNSPTDPSVTGAWAGLANEIPEMSRSSSLQSVSVNWLGEPPRPMRIGLMEDVDVFSRLRSFHACLLTLKQLDHVTNPYAWGRFACRRIHSGYFTFQKPIEMLSA